MMNRDQGQLLYLDIAAELRHEIAAGRLRGRLPSERELAAHYGVSRVTMRRALRQLLDEQLIHRLARRGTFTGRPPAPDKARVRRRVAFFFCGTGAMERYETVLLTGMSRCCSAEGEHLFIESFADGCELRQRLPLIMLSEAPEVVLLSGEVTLGMLEFLTAGGAAVILLSSPPLAVVQQNYDLCCLDWYGWGYRAARYLIAHGYRRIALIGGPENNNRSQSIAAGVQAAHEEDGMTHSPGLSRHCARKGGRQGFNTLLELVELEYPDAIICGSAALGQGVAAGLSYLDREHHLPLIMPKAASHEHFSLGQVKYLDFSENDAVKKCRQLVEYRLRTAGDRFRCLSPIWNFYDS